MPKKEIVVCKQLPAAQAPLSQAARFGDLVFVQGCTGRNPATGAAGMGIKEQTRFALSRIRMILESAGTSLDNVLTNTCYISRREDLPGFNEAYAEHFQERRPARTTIIVNFGAPDNLVEITSTACIPG